MRVDARILARARAVLDLPCSMIMLSTCFNMCVERNHQA